MVSTALTNITSFSFYLNRFSDNLELHFNNRGIQEYKLRLIASSKVFSYLSKFLAVISVTMGKRTFMGDSMAEWLRRQTLDPQVPASSPVLITKLELFFDRP